MKLRVWLIQVQRLLVRLVKNLLVIYCNFMLMKLIFTCLKKIPKRGMNPTKPMIVIQNKGKEKQFAIDENSSMVLIISK